MEYVLSSLIVYSHSFMVLCYLQTSRASFNSIGHIQELIDWVLLEGEGHDLHDICDRIIHKKPSLRQHFDIVPKDIVATTAVRHASDKRRRRPGKFECVIKNCSSSFTRKAGLRSQLLFFTTFFLGY